MDGFNIRLYYRRERIYQLSRKCYPSAAQGEKKKMKKFKNRANLKDMEDRVAKRKEECCVEAIFDKLNVEDFLELI